MDTKNTRNYKVYLPSLDEWVEVTEEQYTGYYQSIWATRKCAQAHGQCRSPKSQLWRCDGDCLACPYRTAGDTASLNAEDSNGLSLMDKLEDNSIRMEDMIADQAELEQLFSRLDAIMPEARRIGELRLSGFSDTEIARILGIARTTFLSRLKRAAQILKDEYKDMF